MSCEFRVTVTVLLPLAKLDISCL